MLDGIGIDVIASTTARQAQRRRLVELGGVLLVDSHGIAHEERRTARRVAQDDLRLHLLTLVLDGGCVVEQGGARAELGPGDLAVVDTRHAFERAFPGPHRVLDIAFPHPMIPAEPRTIETIAATCIGPDEGLAGVLVPLLRRLADGLDGLRGWTGIRVAHSAVELAGSVLGEAVAARAGDGQDAPTRFLVCCELIRARLGDPDLGPERIAAAAFVSVRQLHALFHAQGTTVSRHIRERRLERCRIALADPAQAHRSVGDIAAGWGLYDTAHFSRVFRAAYGASPTEYRRAVVAAREAVPA